MTDSWAGDERRSIPIHILNHVDERLGVHAERVEKAFVEHTAEEMDRYTDIRNDYTELRSILNEHRAESSRKHIELCKSFDAFSDRTEMIYTNLNEAFPTDRNGKPDFHGHAKAHEAWIESSKETKELVAYVKKVVVAACSMGLVSWITFLMWEGILRGPVK